MWIELHTVDGEPRLFNTDNISVICADSINDLTQLWVDSNNFCAVRESVDEIKGMILRGNRYEDR